VVIVHWWVIGLALLALAAGTATLVRWNTRTLKRKVRRLERLAARRTRELEIAQHNLEHLVTHDRLTGIPSRRFFWERARGAAAQASRYKTGLAFIVVDLDRLESINETHGHAAGDEALRFTAHRLGQITRSSDVLARYGGEEFVILLNQTSGPSAERAAERMREHLSAEPCRLEDGVEIPVTASFGVALWRGREEDLEELFSRAHAAVREAKQSRNAVATSDVPATLDPPSAAAPVS